MKKILLSAALLAFLMPQADAQIFGQGERRANPGWNQRNDGYGYGNGNYGYGNNGYGNGRYQNSYVRNHPLYRQIANGAFRPADARRIDAELRRIEQMEWAFLRDNGHLGMRERRVLDDRLTRLDYRLRGNRGYARY